LLKVVGLEPLKVAVTVWLVFMLTVQLPVPEQAPLHPPKVEPLAAAAVYHLPGVMDYVLDANDSNGGSAENGTRGVTEHPLIIGPGQGTIWSSVDIDLTHGRKDNQVFFGNLWYLYGTGLDGTSLFFDLIGTGDTVGDLVSWLSTAVWMVGDMIYGKTRVDGYSDHWTIVAGNNTTTSLLASTLGQLSIFAGPVSPIVDSVIDGYLFVGDLTAWGGWDISPNRFNALQGYQVLATVSHCADAMLGGCSYPLYIQAGEPR
jgi:hypothetical protein